MLRVLVAVLVDLWQFATRSVKRLLIEEVDKQVPALTEAPSVRQIEHTKLLLAATTDTQMETPLATPRDGQLVVGVMQASVRSGPTFAFDTELTKVSYGAVVNTGQRSGRFIQITTATGVEGWILYEELKRNVAVWPLFRHSSIYSAGDEMTKRLRFCIDDAFATAQTNLPLQGEEYVAYCLWRARRSIRWPITTGRVAGSWHRKLKGVRGVHIDVIPRTGSIMEYVVDEVGYVAMVEAVLPGQTIHVSSVGLFEDGMYTEFDLDSSQWQDLQPVFITLT